MGMTAAEIAAELDEDEEEETGATIEVADWVLRLRPEPQVLALYVYMCCLALQQDGRGDRATLTKGQADDYAGGGEGSGRAALSRLIRAGALRKIRTQAGGGECFLIMSHPPEAGAVRR